MNKNKKNESFTFEYIKHDLPAGLVVFFVALPLCLGVALASGAPLFSGIITGIVGGIVVSFASGSQLSVSGPAAGLTVIVINAINQIGSFESFLLAVVLAGFIQIVLGYLKAGIIGYYFPSSVIKGMLAAIGIILILKQIPHAFGYDIDNIGDEQFFQTDGENSFTELYMALHYLHPGAIAIAAVSLFLLITWEKPFLRKFTFFKIVPGALIAVIVGVFLNEIFSKYFPELKLDGDKLVKLPVASSGVEFLKQFTFPDFKAFSNYQVYVVAITIAIIASLESLLSVEATDKLDPFKRNTPTNRELKAQGLGNMIAGLIGGIPLTAVIVRSSANIAAGGRTKLAAFFHGLFLLISVVFMATLLNKIPLACLAALLLMVGYKLAKISLFKSMYKLGWEQFIPFITTVIVIQFSDLLKGIAVGMLIAIIFIFRNVYLRIKDIKGRKNPGDFGLETMPAAILHLLKNNYKTEYYYKRKAYKTGETIVIQLDEDVSFINKGSIAFTLEDLPENASVIIDGSKSHKIDLDVLEIIHDFKNSSRLKNIKVTLKSIPDFKGIAGH